MDNLAESDLSVTSTCKIQQEATEQELCSREEKLANHLRKLCTSWGTEQEDKLFDTSQVLLSLGKIYLRKAELQQGIAQKLTFVKCATLIIAAKVRFDGLLYKNRESRRATDVFKDMTTTLLGACNAHDKGRDLLLVSEDISKRLRNIREEEKKFIASDLQPIGTDFSESELYQKQTNKIERVKFLMASNSAQYVGIMQTVSEECIKTLGNPPCKFALVGLGSLAREEVTVYSDFEHVIMLERGVSDSFDTSIREYFRWYTVLFQIIIIGVGETMVPTVGIESLNNLYSDDKSTNWFFDLYTPSGVSFDGRFPHACKMPLGVQDPSASVVVELIQPVNKMLEYLSGDERLKNLKDILLRTCFVHGSKEVYEDFHAGVVSHMQNTEPDKNVIEQVQFYLRNVNPAMNCTLEGRARTTETMDFEKLKDFLYRPVTVAVGCLRQIYRRYFGSNLDFFSWFRKSYQSVDLHGLEYAYAVACEVRLKLYSKVGHQRRNARPGCMGEFVGKRCFARSIQSVLTVGMIFRAVSENSIRFEKFISCLALLDQVLKKAAAEADMYDLLGFYDDSIRQRKTEEDESASTYFSAGLVDMEKIDEHFEKAEEILNQDPEKMTFEHVSKMSFIHFRRGRYREGFDLAEKWTSNFREKKLGPLNDFRYMQVQHTKASCLPHCMDPKDAAKYAEEEIKRSPDPMSQIVFGIDLSDARVLLGDLCGAQLSLKNAALMSMKPSTAGQLPADIHQQLTQMIFKKQMRHGWKNDAQLTFAALGMLRPTVHKNTTERHVVRPLPKLTPKQIEGKTELFKEWAELEHADEHSTSNSLMHKDAIVQLLLLRGIDNFAEVASRFNEAPPKIMHCRVIYTSLNAHMARYCTRIPILSFSQIGRDLMAVFSTFSQHVVNPLFIGTLRSLVVVIVKRSADIKCELERLAFSQLRCYGGSKSALFRLALKRLLKFRLEDACHIWWHILNDPNQTPQIIKSSSRLLCYVTAGAVPFFQLLHLLQGHRDNFLHRHSCPVSCGRMTSYNGALLDYAHFRFEKSAAALWKIVCQSSAKSRIGRKSTEMLMFVILTVWECNGYLMKVGEKYVTNEPVRMKHAARGALYADLNFALMLSSRDSLTAVSNAFATAAVDDVRPVKFLWGNKDLI